MDALFDRIFFLGFLLVFFLTIVWGGYVADGRSKCLLHGYPIGRVSIYPIARYCVKRIDQTDVVVPLESLEPKP